MKILITGASGNVGTHIVEALARDHEIVAVSREAGDNANLLRSYIVDFATEPKKISDIFAIEKPNVVIHLAALLGKVCEENPDLAEQVNVDATQQIADLSVTHGAQHFIFFSTASVYYQRDLTPTNEESNIHARTVYGQTKLKAETVIDTIAKSSANTRFTTLRPFNIYGPNFKQSLVYSLIHSDEAHPVNLFGFENLYRDYVHISDVVNAVQLVLSHEFSKQHTIMNIGSGIACNNAMLTKAIEQAGLHPVYKKGAGDKLDVSWADISRAQSTIGFNPSTKIIVDR